MLFRSVDDGSTDGTRDLLVDLADELIDQLCMHEKNLGKGAALRTGFEQVKGHVVVIQDADLEYDPQELPVLLEPILSGKADAVYGSRFLGGVAPFTSKMEAFRCLLFPFSAFAILASTNDWATSESESNLSLNNLFDEYRVHCAL